jgi:chromate transport protein ChrA
MMNFSKLTDRDNILFGFVTGLLLPLPVFLILLCILILVQHFFQIGIGIKQMDVFLLGLVANMILIRHYFVTRRYEQTGKGLIFITLICLIAFFVFLKNINLSISL